MRNSLDSLRSEQCLPNGDHIVHALTMVDINPIEMCNRTCTFCPRSDSSLYKNSPGKITTETCLNLAESLLEMDFTGRIGFAGFGEPLLHKELEECIQIIYNKLPKIKWIEVNTNGDFLDADRLRSIVTAGVNTISVSMYDNDITETIEEISSGVDVEIIYRHHYNSKTNYNLNIIDRKNIIENKINYNYNKPCYIPFYKTFIDWNGDILLCDNDWNRTVTFGNINDNSLKDIWLGTKMMEYRKQLIDSRNKLNPCTKCNAHGVIRGIESVNIFLKNENI